MPPNSHEHNESRDLSFQMSFSSKVTRASGEMALAGKAQMCLEYTVTKSAQRIQGTGLKNIEANLKRFPVAKSGTI